MKYLEVTCPTCHGKGMLPLAGKYYRVFRKYDDNVWQDPKEFSDVKVARKYMQDHKDSTYVFMLVAPDGNILYQGSP